MKPLNWHDRINKIRKKNNMKPWDFKKHPRNAFCFSSNGREIRATVIWHLGDTYALWQYHAKFGKVPNK